MMLCCIKWLSEGAPDTASSTVLGAPCLDVARCEKFPGDGVPGQTDSLLKLRLRSTQRPFIHHRVQGLTQLGAILQLPPCAFPRRTVLRRKVRRYLPAASVVSAARYSISTVESSANKAERFSASSTGSSLIFCRISEALRASLTESSHGVAFLVSGVVQLGFRFLDSEPDLRECG